MKLNNLRELDYVSYAKYQEKKERLGIKPYTFNVINITFM